MQLSRSSDSMHCSLLKIFSEGKRLVRTLLALGSGIREADRQRPGRAPEHGSPSPIQPVGGQPLPGNCQLWAPPAAGHRAAAILRQCEQALADTPAAPSSAVPAAAVDWINRHSQREAIRVNQESALGWQLAAAIALQRGKHSHRAMRAMRDTWTISLQRHSHYRNERACKMGMA